MIGAGVVGLACARALARDGRDVIVLEAESEIGTGISSRNSEVIHAGLYYPAGSLKARFCVEGRRRLYAYCVSHGIAHRRCGKLIVATTPDEVEALEGLQRKGHANGVEDLTLIDGAQARRLEPALSCVAALLSPSTGIVDSHGLMLSLQGEGEDSGMMLARNSPVLSGTILPDGFRLRTGGETPSSIKTRIVINAAGLSAPSVAAALEGFDPCHVPRSYYAKGSYFILTGSAPFSRLIYPAPDIAGLGIHLTLDLAGQARFGPDVEWVKTPDYDVDPDRAPIFEAAIRRYWPELPEGGLVPGYAGVRPKIQAPGEPARDFLLQGPADHGIAGLVNLFGIESPGLTSSLALADAVLEALRD